MWNLFSYKKLKTTTAKYSVINNKFIRITVGINHDFTFFKEILNVEFFKCLFIQN